MRYQVIAYIDFHLFYLKDYKRAHQSVGTTNGLMLAQLLTLHGKELIFDCVIRLHGHLILAVESSGKVG